MTPITVILAEDHHMVRAGLVLLLKQEEDIQIVGEAENGLEVVNLTRTLVPDVVIMDIAMPQLNGLEATRQILRISPKTKVLILSAHSEEAYVESVLAMGAAGYLNKQTAASILPKAIRRVHSGKRCVSPGIAQRLQHHRQKALQQGEPPPAKSATRLSSREIEVLQMIAEGNANKETAAKLHISIKTVEKHRQKVMEKLNIHNTAGLTRYAIAANIIESTCRTPCFHSFSLSHQVID